MRRAVCALAAMAVAQSMAVPAGLDGPGRHFLLGEEDKAAGLVRFYSQAIELAEGARETWVTITRTGDFNDPRYGDFKITPTHLEQMVANFNARTLGQDVFLDVAHKPNDGAAGKFLKLTIEGGRLRGLVQWTEFGLDAVKKRGFAYLSAEFNENWKDNEKQQAHGCVLLGAGLTTRPVIKHLDPVTLSEQDDDHSAEMRVLVSPHLLRELTEKPTMNFLEQLGAKLTALGLTEPVITRLLAQARTQLEAAADDTARGAIVLAWEETGRTIDTELKKLSAGGQPGNVTITLAQPGQTVDVAAEVTRLLAEREQQAAAARTTLDAKVKLLSDTIRAGDTTLDDEGVRQLAQTVLPFVTVATTDDQVKALANMQVEAAKKLSAATKLATLGFRSPTGSLHITVDSSNEVKSLQQTLDKRLGLTKEEGDTERFYATGGRLLAANKAFADVVLAQYDHDHGAQLAAEHKALAAGTGTISDIRVPYSVERTVLREALYNLVALNFMDVGTSPLAPTVQIPYSYRDTTAAGTLNARIYERQAIQKAGMIQTWDTAYPIPQKLAFNVSNEMQYLLADSPIDYDPIAENVRNIVRIVGEDTEALCLNEIARSADEHSVAAGNDTLTAQVNGTNKIFVLTQFPVVRPRRYFDLQGAQVGSTVNPITVTLNSVARTEYLPNADGTALAAGTYWVMDYNLGELRFVDQTGAAVTPTNGWALVVTYSYSTNAAKVDLDLGSLTVGQKYDAVLTAIGSRRVVIEDDRYYMATMALMTGGVDNALGQATTFTANGARVGTSLNADGTVGVTKGVPTFKVRGPGLLINDNRILVGERGNSRFRMCRPWAMGQLQDARNSAGAFIGAKEGYGEQYVVAHTPVNRKLAATSLILYSATGRVARAA